jgi:hypothetical protein
LNSGQAGNVAMQQHPGHEDVATVFFMFRTA